MLIEHLPRDSALNRELHGEAAEWSVTDHLLAAAVDHLAAANWMFASVNSAEDGDQPELPAPVPRPVDLADPADPADPAEETDGAGTGAGEGAAAAPADTGTEAGATTGTGTGTAAPSAVQLARFFA